jgi:hypothetical protein
MLPKTKLKQGHEAQRDMAQKRTTMLYVQAPSTTKAGQTALSTRHFPKI